ncbi:MAG: hypothetical protein RBQ97_03445 [Acholeplasma sp.]|nr:hypothetical protein [Acholeplasma sp.]
MYNQCPKCDLLIRNKKHFKKCPNCHSKEFLVAQENQFSIKKLEVDLLLDRMEKRLEEVSKYKLIVVLTAIFIIPALIFIMKISVVVKSAAANIYVMQNEKIKLTKEQIARMDNMVPKINDLRTKVLMSFIIMILVLVGLFILLNVISK